MKQIPILYSDDEIFIINKPFGLAVQGGANIKESVDSILPKQVNQKIFTAIRKSIYLSFYANSSIFLLCDSL